MHSLKNKIAVITGIDDEKSVGYVVALALKNAGATVIFCLNTPKRFFSKNDIVYYTHNITDFNSVLRQNIYIKKVYGPIDILVNCAEILECPKSMSYTMKDMEKVRRIFAVNLFGAINWYGAVIKGMIARDTGCIINVLPATVVHGRLGNYIYTAVKDALINFTEAWEREVALRTLNIKVGVVAPGFVETGTKNKMSTNILRDAAPPHRIMQPTEISNIVLSLIQQYYRGGGE